MDSVTLHYKNSEKQPTRFNEVMAVIVAGDYLHVHLRETVHGMPLSEIKFVEVK